MLFFFVFHTIIRSEFQKDRSYSVSVKSKYSNVQPLDHFLYFLSDFNINTSNHFLNSILQHTGKEKSINDIEFLFSTASEMNLISSSSLSFLRTYIDLNYFLPRCEMFRSISLDITTDSINLINGDSGYFLASKIPIEKVNYFQTNFTQIFDFDLYLNSFNRDKETLFIYADLTKQKASELVLSIINHQNSEFSDFNIILRPISFTQTAANLRGFGVEMRPYQYIMEYEIDETSETKKPLQIKPNKEDLTTKSVNFDVSSDYLNFSEINFFGSRFISFLDSEKATNEEENKIKETPELLRDMSNNWPLYLRRISEEDVSVDSNKQIEKVSIFAEKFNEQQNQNKNEDNGQIYPIASINGRAFNLNNFDPFTFMDNLQEELRFSDFLHDEFNLTKDDVSFNKPFFSNDEFLLDYRTKYAIWDKDYEKDEKYKDWSTNIKDIFHLKKNILNFAIYIDPTSPRHTTELYTLFLLSQPEKFDKGLNTPSLPMRIGIIPYFNLGNRISRRISFAFAHIALHNPSDAFMFLLNSLAILTKNMKNKKEGNQMREDHYMKAYNKITGDYKLDWNDLHKLYGKDSNEYKFIKEANKYFKSCGVKLGAIKINGRDVSLDKSLQDLILQVKDMVISISKICARENILDLKNVDIVDILKKEYLVVDSINNKVIKAPAIGTNVFKMRSSKQKEFIEAIKKVEWSHKDSNDPRSYFILFTPETVINDEANESNKSVDATGCAAVFNDFAMNASHKRSTAFAVNPPVFRELIGIDQNETALLVNGRLYHSFKFDNADQLKLIDLWSDHFVLSYIDRMTGRKENSEKPPVHKEKEDEDEENNDEIDENDRDEDEEEKESENENESDVKSKKLSFEALSYLSAVACDWRSLSVKRIDIQEIIDSVSEIKETSLYYNSNKDHSKSDKLEFIMIIDPLSRNFQKTIDFFYHMSSVRKSIDLQFILVPPQTISAEQQKNLDSYYRFSLESDEVTFSMLDDTISYSTILDTPQSWLLETLRTSENIDIDNVQLKVPKSDSQASFVLTSIVVEGSCIIRGADNPKFAEIGLFTRKSQRNNFRSEKVDETTVLTMNSYFQFKADPGVYRTTFSTNTSSHLYMFDKNEYRNKEFPLFENIRISTFSKNELVIFARTRATNADAFKHSLEERIDRLRTESIMSNKTKSKINIFTISSGKLYEKLCKIMFLSVREHTNSAITFYLIKSFLSPSFKASLPEMSKRYSFNYYLVDYKWPSFLLKQKEKQRFIWANKILFLDVLFPTSVDKIIYVDADQIVRSDLQELMDMNITGQGAPYAFVPFCDSREEIESYRFWKQGYWKEVLTKEKSDQISSQNIQAFDTTTSYKYHISALFLVDMIKFKEISTGDLLRIQYQQLAGNPNNLANLDQDLPNLMQKHVPIYSLSQDWLWCETWCADEEMEKAKTIDLCNNPLTKINKVEIAKNRIEEWPKLESEAKKTEDNYSSSDYEQIVFHN